MGPSQESGPKHRDADTSARGRGPAGRRTERRYTPVSSFAQLCRKMRDVHGDKVLYRYYDQRRNLAEMTYRQFAGNVARQAAGFRHLGLAGKRIAVVGDSSPEWMQTYLAAVVSGGVIVPLDKDLLVPEYEGFLKASEAEAIVFSRSFNGKFGELVQRPSGVRYFIPMDTEDCPFAGDAKVVSYATLLAHGDAASGADAEADAPGNPERLAVLLFTSGTTGTSKCVQLSEKNVCACLNAACGCVEFFPEDTVVSVLPLYHTYELSCMLAEMNYGITIGLNDSLKNVMKNFATFRPTGLILVPLFVNAMHRKILDEAAKKGLGKVLPVLMQVSRWLRRFGIDLRARLFKDVRAAFGGRLVKIVCGGAPMNPDLMEFFAEFGIEVVEGYGITECSPLVSVNPYFAPRKGSVGPTVESCRARIDGGARNALGYSEGEIVVKGDNVMLGYTDPAQNVEAFTADGWFKTGDIGYMDHDGYLYITGRKKSVIVLSNGKNVSPEELEEYLEKLEGVAESVVVGRKAADGEAITLTAIVVPAFDRFPKGAGKEAIAARIRAQIEAVNDQLPVYKRIRSTEIRETEFEKTSSKKIKRYLVH